MAIKAFSAYIFSKALAGRSKGLYFTYYLRHLLRAKEAPVQRVSRCDKDASNAPLMDAFVKNRYTCFLGSFLAPILRTDISPITDRGVGKHRQKLICSGLGLENNGQFGSFVVYSFIRHKVTTDL